MLWFVLPVAISCNDALGTLAFLNTKKDLVPRLIWHHWLLPQLVMFVVIEYEGSSGTMCTLGSNLSSGCVQLAPMFGWKFMGTWCPGADPGILSVGVQTLFEKKSSSAWAPTHSQVPCLCKNKGAFPCFCKNPPLVSKVQLELLHPRYRSQYVRCHLVPLHLGSWHGQQWHLSIQWDGNTQVFVNLLEQAFTHISLRFDPKPKVSVNSKSGS